MVPIQRRHIFTSVGHEEAWFTADAPKGRTTGPTTNPCPYGSGSRMSLTANVGAMQSMQSVNGATSSDAKEV